MGQSIERRLRTKRHSRRMCQVREAERSALWLSGLWVWCWVSWPMALGSVGAAMAGMYYLVFWQRRSTATVINATGVAHARRLAAKQKKQGYGSIASAQRAVAADIALIRKGSWVRRRRNGTSPQFGSAKQKAAARSLHSAYRSWLWRCRAGFGITQQSAEREANDCSRWSKTPLSYRNPFYLLNYHEKSQNVYFVVRHWLLGFVCSPYLCRRLQISWNYRS